jgi:hypothetical protein
MTNKNLFRKKTERIAYSFILLSVLQEIHRLFQSEFLTECDLVLRRSISSTLNFAYSHPVATDIIFVLFS